MPSATWRGLGREPLEVSVRAMIGRTITTTNFMEDTAAAAAAGNINMRLLNGKCEKAK